MYGQPVAFYNQRWVQQSLGVPVNFTVSAFSVAYNMVYGTGDVVAPTYDTLEYILDAGIGVAFVYGDRDFDCNCKSLQDVSISLPAILTCSTQGWPLRTSPFPWSIPKPPPSAAQGTHPFAQTPAIKVVS